MPTYGPQLSDPAASEISRLWGGGGAPFIHYRRPTPYWLRLSKKTFSLTRLATSTPQKARGDLLPKSHEWTSASLGSNGWRAAPQRFLSATPTTPATTPSVAGDEEAATPVHSTKERTEGKALAPSGAGVVGVASDPHVFDAGFVLCYRFFYCFFTIHSFYDTAFLLHTVSTILLRAQINFSFCFFQQFS
jgi:hypothetical protein